MSKASIRAKRQKQLTENEYRIQAYGACPHCGNGFVYFGVDASFCSNHGWVPDKSFVIYKIMAKQTASNDTAFDMAV